MAEIMKLENVSKHFQGLKAVDQVSFTVRDDEIFGLIGPNGAGKTTLFNLMTGFYEPTSGKVIFDGKDMSKKKVHEFSHAGLARTFQNIRVFGKMSVEENLIVGMHNTYHPGIAGVLLNTGKQRRMEAELRDRASDILKYLHIEDYTKELAGSLPYGIQRKVEIGRALASNPKMLLLDEPTAGMNDNETMELADLIKDIFHTKKIAVLVIEHNMQFITELTQKIAVLSFGKRIALGTADEVLNNQEVIDAYLGEEDD